MSSQSHFLILSIDQNKHDLTWPHDRVFVSGEVVLHLSNIPRISMDKGVDSVPVVMMPLKRPADDARGPLEVSFHFTRGDVYRAENVKKYL